MDSAKYIILENRSIIEISGDDSRNFLQGIITNDINKVNEQNSIFALILTPQGKFLFDLFISEKDGKLLLDCNKSHIDDLVKRLSMYKLRSKVAINNAAGSYSILAIINNGREIDPKITAQIKSLSNVMAVYDDPRNKNMGLRVILKKEHDSALGTYELRNSGIVSALENSGITEGKFDDYELQRIQLVVPEGDKELIPDKSFPLLFNMEELNAIDFKKGCYVGQEVTARTKYRGVLRKKLFKIEAKNELPKGSIPIQFNNNEIGELLTSVGKIGLAILEKEAVEKSLQENSELFTGDIQIKIL